MATIRSLKEVRKQYKEKALEATQVSAGPQPSPPVSECDFYSTATDVMDDAARMKMSKDEDELKVVESENDGREVHSRRLLRPESHFCVEKCNFEEG